MHAPYGSVYTPPCLTASEASAGSSHAKIPVAVAQNHARKRRALLQTSASVVLRLESNARYGTCIHMRPHVLASPIMHNTTVQTSTVAQDNAAVEFRRQAKNSRTPESSLYSLDAQSNHLGTLSAHQLCRTLIVDKYMGKTMLARAHVEPKHYHSSAGNLSTILRQTTALPRAFNR